MPEGFCSGLSPKNPLKRFELVLLSSSLWSERGKSQLVLSHAHRVFWCQYCIQIPRMQTPRMTHDGLALFDVCLSISRGVKILWVCLFSVLFLIFEPCHVLEKLQPLRA